MKKDQLPFCNDIEPCFEPGLGRIFHFFQDEDMHYKVNDVYAVARTSNLNEELGQVSASVGTGQYQRYLRRL